MFGWVPLCWFCCFFFKQKTAYEMRISDWSSDVCSSDLARSRRVRRQPRIGGPPGRIFDRRGNRDAPREIAGGIKAHRIPLQAQHLGRHLDAALVGFGGRQEGERDIDRLRAFGYVDVIGVHVNLVRSEEHTSELQSLMR